MMPKPLTIILADDHAIIRMGVILLLKETYKLTAYEASNGRDLFKLVKKHRADIIIMDINMPETSPQLLVEEILEFNPSQNILIFSMNKEEIYGKIYLQLGARGYLHKESPPADLVKAVEFILDGNIYMKKIMQELYFDPAPIKNNTFAYSRLSKKEIELLHFFSTGDPLTKIAELMNLSPSTVGTHKSRILSKLHLDNLSELREYIKLNPLA